MDSLGAKNPIIRDKREIFLFVAVLTLVFLSRLPFVSSTSYGTDADASRVAVVARQMAETGQYTASRNPGHPVQEIPYTFISNQDPFLFNMATVLMSVIAVAFFGLFARQMGLDDYIWAMVAFAFVPVVYINSTNATDFMWSLAFAFGCLYFASIEKPVVAGIMMGISLGCRVTGALYGVLVLMLFLPSDGPVWRLDSRWWRQSVTFGVSALVSAVVVFLPPWLTYGSSMFDAGHANQGFVKTMQYMTTSLWGVLGCAAVATAFGLWLWPVRTGKLTDRPISVQCGVGVVVVIAGYILWFLLYTGKAAYLLPVVPLVIFLAGFALPKTGFRTICAALILSPFVLGISQQSYLLAEPQTCCRIDVPVGGKTLAVFPVYGQVLLDNSRKTLESANVEYLRTLDLPEDAVVVSYVYLLKIKALIPEVADRFVYLLSRNDLDTLRGQGKQIYYLQDAAEHSVRMYGVDLAAEGAQVIRLPYEYGSECSDTMVD